MEFSAVLDIINELELQIFGRSLEAASEECSSPDSTSALADLFFKLTRFDTTRAGLIPFEDFKLILNEFSASFCTNAEFRGAGLSLLDTCVGSFNEIHRFLGCSYVLYNS
jgi:hypothetical protein